MSIQNNFKHATIFLLILGIVALIIAVLIGISKANVEKIIIEKEQYAKSKEEAIEIITECINNDFENIYCYKTWWYKDREKGYKYWITARKKSPSKIIKENKK